MQQFRSGAPSNAAPIRRLLPASTRCRRSASSSQWRNTEGVQGFGVSPTASPRRDAVAAQGCQGMPRFARSGGPSLARPIGLAPPLVVVALLCYGATALPGSGYTSTRCFCMGALTLRGVAMRDSLRGWEAK